ncbi:MAG: PLP-dependent transferase [Tannerella sp.]|jgi:O-acetylhomoserine (thiol)-lyase|nr:PLP-dependent transferase [Tannerella sp.]
MYKKINDSEDESNCKFQTRIISSAFPKPDVYGAINEPIYRNAAFEYPDSQSIEEAFKFRTDVYTYSRIINPTVTNLEEKIRRAANAEGVLALASGMAAISNVFISICYAGCNIVSSPHLFGNTFSFFKSTLASFGVEMRFVDVRNPDEVVAAVDDNTVAFFCEVLSNPHIEIADLPLLSELLHNKNVPLIIDTTVIPWCGFDARKAGVDIEVVSTTKYISGGATSIGGAIIDYDVFDWTKNKKLGAIPVKPSGMSLLMFKLRAEIARNIGACMSPDTAYLQSVGMETLQLRYEKMSATAYNIALHLSQHPKVQYVHYPKLDCSPFKALSDKLFKGNPGAMFSINLESKQACYRFMDSLKIIRRATNLFDNKTLVIHPESTIYGSFPPDLKRLIGIEDNLLRFSAGLEDEADIIADIENGLQSA